MYWRLYQVKQGQGTRTFFTIEGVDKCETLRVEEFTIQLGCTLRGHTNHVRSSRSRASLLLSVVQDIPNRNMPSGDSNGR